MPSKVLYSMAGLDRKVLNSRRITKIMAPSNPVFSRSFITSFGVASHNLGGSLTTSTFRPFFFFPFFSWPQRKKQALLARLLKKVYICTAKPTKQLQDNEGIFI